MCIFTWSWIRKIFPSKILFNAATVKLSANRSLFIGENTNVSEIWDLTTGNIIVIIDALANWLMVFLGLWVFGRNTWYSFHFIAFHHFISTSSYFLMFEFQNFNKKNTIEVIVKYKLCTNAVCSCYKYVKGLKMIFVLAHPDRQPSMSFHKWNHWHDIRVLWKHERSSYTVLASYLLPATLPAKYKLRESTKCYIIHAYTWFFLLLPFFAVR